MKLLRTFEVTLRRTGYIGDIVVLYTSDVDVSTYVAQVSSIRFILAETFSTHHAISQYADLLTKVHIFNMIDYEQIIYYDLDFVFQSNPDMAFTLCGREAICACQDSGVTKEDVLESNLQIELNPNNYFNAGFLVIRPLASTYLMIKNKINTIDISSYKYAEQDLLNLIFVNRWKKLDQVFNLMHISNVNSHIVAIHEKLW